MLLLPMKSLDPSAEVDIKALLNALRPDCVVVDACNYRMKALYPYVTMSESSDHFRSHAALDRLRAGTLGARDFSRIWWHLILNNNSSMTSLVRLCIDYAQNSLETMPGADLILAYKESGKYSCKLFYGLDRGYNTSIDRILKGLSFKEWYDFSKVFFSTLNAQLAIDSESVPDAQDLATLESSKSVIKRRFRWVHHVGIVERGVLLGLQIKRLSLSLQPTNSKDSKDASSTEESLSSSKDGKLSAEDFAKGKPGDEPHQAATATASTLTVAFVNSVLIPFVVLEWCEDRSAADAVDLINRLSSPTENLSAKELSAYVQQVKDLHIKENKEFTETGRTPEANLVEKLNEGRGLKFLSSSPFKEADVLAGGSNFHDADQTLNDAPLRTSPFPFDMMHLMRPSTNEPALKSASFSRLRA